MQIEFAGGEAGYHEARALYRIARQAQELEPAGSEQVQLLDALRGASEAHMALPEFDALRAEYPAPADFAPAGHGRRGWWRSLFGPSRREVMLSAQRTALLERAERAERSAFEALAETARVARERDAAKARCADLERRAAAAAERQAPR